MFKSEVILGYGMFDCEKCNKMLSEMERLKISNVAFTMVGINDRFDLTASKELIEACYLMQISRKKELGTKMLKKQLKQHLTMRTVRLNRCSFYHRITGLIYIGYLL